MKFNVLRMGNREFVDIGDLTTCLYNLSLTKNKMDKITLATVISAHAYIASKFAEKQPSEKIVYEISVTDGIFFKEMKRVFKENKKRLPKDQEYGFFTVDQETYAQKNLLEKVFTDEQIEQIKELLNSQTGELQKVFEEAVKGIKINVTPPAPVSPSGTAKKKQ